jgi:hypothetical protein
MRRLLASSILALLALGALAGGAVAKTPRPVVTSVSPTQVGIGGTLVLKGKNFRSGARNNRVFFSRATDGKSVRARPLKASKRRIEVVVPKSLSKFLGDDGTVPTRFQIAVFTKVLGPKTKKSRSPVIFPAGSAPVTPGAPGSPATPPPPPPDCDGDGTPDAQDADDDNDGLTDTLEVSIKTSTCNKDTDGDLVGDAYEYYASLDLNGSPNYAGKRPYPNPLDGSDAAKDFDGDGLTMTEEYLASVKFGTATSAPLTYSDGDQTSAAPANNGALDLNENSAYRAPGEGISDDEKDADNDGLPNWVELAKGEPTPYSGTDTPAPCDFKDVTGPHTGSYASLFTDCGIGRMPNGNTFTEIGATVTGAPAPPDYYKNDFLDPDTDGDGILDGADDLDHDGYTNVEEIRATNTTGKYPNVFSNPVDPCDPDVEARTCPTHPTHT